MEDLRIVATDRQPETEEPSVDDWDLDGLKCDGEYPAVIGGQRIYSQVPVQRPDPLLFVRFREGPEWRLNVTLFILRERRETYLVHPRVADALKQESHPYTLFYGLDRTMSPFLWAVRLPKDGEPDNPWWMSARDAVTFCFSNWARLRSDQTNKGYVVVPLERIDAIPDPEWPANLTMRELVRLAFQRYRIDDLDHAIVRGLRGI